jgi:transposase
MKSSSLDGGERNFARRADYVDLAYPDAACRAEREPRVGIIREFGSWALCGLPHKAHLIRDLRYLTTLPDKVTKNYGMRVLDAIKKLFRVIHRREKMRPLAFRRALEKAKAVILKKALAAPTRREAQTMAVRFKTHGESYFTFITSPGVQPTNNSAEQAIRHVVIDRRITQGTRGANGQRWSERIWTALATCAQQGRSAFDFISQSVDANLTGLPPPSLLPA